MLFLLNTPLLGTDLVLPSEKYSSTFFTTCPFSLVIKCNVELSKMNSKEFICKNQDVEVPVQLHTGFIHNFFLSFFD